MVNEKHKDRLFRAIFGGSQPEYTLSLYNAINGTDYDDPGKLEIYTIEDTVYMGMKNDVSFIIDDEINLFEHQSTYNPNMPLRGLFYLAKQYEKYVADKGLDPYSTSIVCLPTPKYVVLYNGKKGIQEREVLKLTDSFTKNPEEAAVEVLATMVNVNYGHNIDIMSRCKPLEDYALFVQKVREYGKANSAEEAIALAIRDAIELNLLDGYFRKHKAEVTDMVLTEYNEQRTLEGRFEEGKEEGKEEIIKALRDAVKINPSLSVEEALNSGLLK